MKKNVIKISLDVIMAVLLVFLYNTRIFNMTFHEVAGLIIFGLFIIHCLFSVKWIAANTAKFFKKGLAARDRIKTIVAFLLFIDFVLIILSGIFISEVLFTSLSENSSMAWQSVHYFCSAIALILIGVHLGLHWQFVMNMFKKVIHIPQKAATPIAIVLMVIVLAFGSYSIVASDFTTWLASPFTGTSENSGGPGGDMEKMPNMENNDGTAPEGGGGTPPDSNSSGGDDNTTDNSTTDNSTTNSSTTDGTATSGSSTASYTEELSITGDSDDSTTTDDSTTDNSSTDNSAGSGNAPEGGSGDSQSIPSQGGEMPENGGNMGGQSSGGPLTVLYTLVTFLSIIGVFTIVTYYIDKLIRSSKQNNEDDTVDTDQIAGFEEDLISAQSVETPIAENIETTVEDTPSQKMEQNKQDI